MRCRSAHDLRAVIFRRALADAQITGDVLAWLSSQDQMHDLSLPQRQVSDQLNGPVMMHVAVVSGYRGQLAGLRGTAAGRALGRQSFRQTPAPPSGAKEWSEGIRKLRQIFPAQVTCISAAGRQ
nr:hypothetical protein [Rhodobacter sp. NTK016B]